MRWERYKLSAQDDESLYINPLVLNNLLLQPYIIKIKE